MTNPPPSPYGPSPYGPATPAPQPQQPQQPQQPPMFHPPQAPSYGHTVVAPTPPKRGNGPGLAALIVGIAAVVTAFLPLVNFVAFVLGPVGIILGIIGLVRAGRPRRQAAWGTALSAASILLALVMIFVYAFVFFVSGTSFAEAPPTREPAPFTPETEAPTDPAFGPYPLGTPVELSDADGQGLFTASVTESVLDATDAVLAVPGNVAAPTGMQWAMVTVDLTLVAVSNLPSEPILVEYATADGRFYTADDVPAVPPGQDLAALQYELDIDESGVGNLVVAIPRDGTVGGSWSIRYGYSPDGTQVHVFEAD